jgi:HEAT repeat protein
MPTKTLLALLALLAASASAESPEILITGLRSGDEAALVQARQLLARHDVRHARLVVQLLEDERQPVWRAAFAILQDWANETAAPGRDTDRALFAASILPLVSRTDSAHLIEQGLRLLPLTAPEGMDLAPVAALLDHPDWREKARTCLQEIGTSEARAALRGNLGTADTGFTIAVIRSLDVLADAEALPKLHELTDHADAGVRAAASRALSRTGSPAYLDAVLAVRAKANEATRWEAEDAVVRLACAMAASGNWDAGINTLDAALNDSTTTSAKAAALQGLGRYGDESALETILDAMNRDDDLYGPGLLALGGFEGESAAEALLAAFPKQPDSTRKDLLAILGKTKDARYLPLLNEAAGSADAGYRGAALDALAATGLPGAVEGLDAAAARLATDEDRAAFARRIVSLAGRYEAAGEKAAAGRTFLLLYRHAASGEDRALALDGVKRNPVPEAFAVLQERMTPEELESLPTSMLAGVARALYDEGKTAEGDALIARIEPRIADTETVRLMIAMMRGRGDEAAWGRKLGFVGRWHLTGPYEWSKEEGFTTTRIGEPVVDLTSSTVLWKAHDNASIEPMIDLMGLVATRDNATAYAYTEVYVTEAQSGQIRVGSDDGIKVWLNGEVVHENHIDRGTALDADTAPVNFAAGKNTLLVQVTQGAGGWNFIARLCAADGRPLAFTYEPTATTEETP